MGYLRVHVTSTHEKSTQVGNGIVKNGESLLSPCPVYRHSLGKKVDFPWKITIADLAAVVKLRALCLLGVFGNDSFQFPRLKMKIFAGGNFPDLG